MAIHIPHYNIFGKDRSLRIAITIACQCAFVLFGYDQGVFSGIVGNQDFLDQFGHPSPSLEGIIVSIYNLGAFSGCILTFAVCDRTGRRMAMWIAMLFIIVGAILQASAFTVPHLMIARYITGIGTGIETSTVPMYQSELCEAERRGRLLVIFLVFGLPESPRWLFKNGYNKEALQVLCDVYGREPDHPKIIKEQKEVLDAIKAEDERGQYKWSQILKRDEVQTGRRVLLAWGMQLMNQLGGINLIVYYITSVLQYNVGLDRNLALILAGVINAMFFIGSLFPTFFLDKYGRRKPMMWGSFGLGISMMMVAILLSFQPRGGDIAHATASASITFFFTYMLIFGATANCIPWVYVPEILPLHARAKGTAIGISSNWIWNFFVVMITPTLIANLAWKGYLIFMALNFAFIPLIYFCYPETSNLTLEEIDWLFLEPHAVKRSKEVSKHGWGERDGWERRRSSQADIVPTESKPDASQMENSNSEKVENGS
ncbi:hypothetical protein E8E14_002596 [Neopestalotiopsis sp. 37M]|nr:hypothetical protein E8E14_002596 [Neopestalotiopsis sp. 37M]